MGLLTARELALEGVCVRLLERGQTGRESSWAGGGILSPLFPWRYPDPVTELARWSQAHYPALLEELASSTGIDPEWTPNGLLMLGVSPEERQAAVAWAFRFGYDIELADEQATGSLEPNLGRGLGEGVWMPGMAHARNPRLLAAIRASVESLGVEIIEQCAVSEILTRNGHVTGVSTAMGDFAATRVTVAGGAWSGQILAPSGVAPPIEPVRGQMILFRAQPGVVNRIILKDGHYVIPRRDGRVLVGSTMERAGFDKETTPSALEELRAAAAQLVPELIHYPLERHWAGLRPGSPEGVPFIGALPDVQGLFVNAGHFRNGVVMGLASCRLLADLVLGRSPVVDPLPYRPRLAHNS